MELSTSELITKIIFPNLYQTLFMVFISMILSTIIGFMFAIILVLTDKNGLKPNWIIYGVLGGIINIVRSFPFIILIVAIMPFTRILIGTSIGMNAALIPLTIAASCFIARLIEGSLKEVNESLIEAAKSFGASDMHIIFKVIIKEAVPSIISNLVVAIVSIVGTTAMAGVVGAGGLGAVALTYGYQNFNDNIMYSTVLILVIIVQFIQIIGNVIYNKVK